MPSMPQQNNSATSDFKNNAAHSEKPPQQNLNKSTIEIKALKKNKKGLNDAFQQFSRLSDEILNSYTHLEAKVEALNDELELVSRQRIEEFEQKELLAQRLQGLLSILPSAVVQVDGKGFIADFNPIAETILSTSLNGKKWFQVVNENFILDQTDGIEAKLKDGRRVHVATCPMTQEKGQLIVLTDISNMHQLKARADRNKRLTSIGRSMASLSHQLRTPLSTALLYVSHLQNKNVSNDKKNDMAKKLQGRLENMNQQIDDMLLFARGGLEMATRFDVKAWFDEIRLDIDDIFYQYNIVAKYEVSFDKQNYIYINQEALKEALMSLVMNACQAVEKEETPKVKLSLKVESNQFHFAISDNGAGVQESVSQELFDPFITSKKKGTGLGLAIVHTVITSAKGKIFWRNKKEGGAEFCFVLPLVQELHEDLVQSTEIEANAQQRIMNKGADMPPNKSFSSKVENKLKSDSIKRSEI